MKPSHTPKIKCEKCGLYFKDRGKDDLEKGTGYVRDLCWNCGFLWKSVGLVLQGVTRYGEKLNRRIVIRLDDIKITRFTKDE